MTTPTVGVCGFGRCGSTMVMRMLDAGGFPPVEGSQPRSYEVERLEDIYGAPPSALAGRAVKLLDLASHADLPPAAWRFVWLDRDGTQQARSAVKFAQGVMGLDLPEGAADRLAMSYAADRPAALGRVRRQGAVIVLRYEQVLARPRRAARQLQRLVPGLDAVAAAAAVHRRDGTCRSDLSFELTVSEREA